VLSFEEFVAEELSGNCKENAVSEHPRSPRDFSCGTEPMRLTPTLTRDLCHIVPNLMSFGHSYLHDRFDAVTKLGANTFWSPSENHWERALRISSEYATRVMLDSMPMASVTKRIEVTAELAGRVDRVVIKLTALSRSQVRGLFSHGCIFING